MHDSPGGALISELLFGEPFLPQEPADPCLQPHDKRALSRDDWRGWVRGHGLRDGYCGWVSRDELGPARAATHWVTARGSHGYREPSVKAPPVIALPLGALVSAEGQRGAFMEVKGGLFVPLRHVKPVTETADDPVAIAEMFLGTPYLWGGRQVTGMDCSGLVQLALQVAGQSCPRDSGLQLLAFGDALRERPRRGDVAFWQGHVGFMCDDRVLLHANAHAMSVTREPFIDANQRIVSSGSPFLGYRRPRRRASAVTSRRAGTGARNRS